MISDICETCPHLKECNAVSDTRFVCPAYLAWRKKRDEELAQWSAEYAPKEAAFS